MNDKYEERCSGCLYLKKDYNSWICVSDYLVEPRSIYGVPCPAGKECGIDIISHPPHYMSETGLEVIDVIEAFTFDLQGIEATDTGNIIKYICRWKKKNGVEDLKKILWYTQHLIDHVEKIEKDNK